MRAFLMQDWTTIRGASTVSTVTQQETNYLDLAAFQDVAFWLDVKEVFGTVTLTLQTAPAEDDSLFTALLPAIGLVTTTTPMIKVALMSTATVPLARFVRWQLTGSGGSGWDTTMRILVAANAPGL